MKVTCLEAETTAAGVTITIAIDYTGNSQVLISLGCLLTDEK
jgi:hypothetical protein